MHINCSRSLGAWTLIGLLVTSGCGSDADTSSESNPDGSAGEQTPASPAVPGGLDVPDTYSFSSRFAPEASSVAYSGQTFRQALVASLKSEMNAIQDEIDSGSVFAAGDVTERLRFFVDFDGATSSEVPHRISTTPPALQQTWGDLGSGSSLVEKIAGNDAGPQHKDWSNGLAGWPGASSPEQLVRQWIEAADALAVSYSAGEVPQGPMGKQIPKWFVSPEGLDYQQLLQKFLLGAVNYSQAADDYLDDADDNGLNSDNTQADDGAPYTALEHVWDEGFGYWGAARNYLEFSDDEIATADGRAEFAAGYHDADGDGAIDLQAEINFSASVNAGKRDRGAAALGVELDLSEQTMQAFLAGRAIIAAADGALGPAEFAQLQEQRDRALDGWERALAGTAIHYFNKTLQDMLADEYDFVTHAKHWGELKGFLLTLQFNPRVQVDAQTLASIHDAVGVAPVLPGDAAEADARAALVQARDALFDAYGFDAALRGDNEGNNGW